jgi:homoserine O-acetyltransferase
METTSHFKPNQPFVLEVGTLLTSLQITYTVYGNLNDRSKPIIWVCHALTANSKVAEWWPGFFGEGTLFNPHDFTIICANIIGSPYGSTHPLHINPEYGKPYYDRFPLVTIRDLANAHDLLRNHLGIERIFLGIGGSMGGMQILEWAIQTPDIFENLILVATNAKHSAWGKAFNESQRMAIRSDATWGQPRADAASRGLAAARSIGMLSYRNYAAYCKTQTDVDGRLAGFAAPSYQQYQGEKLVRRFDAYSYYALTRTMDSHNVGRNRGGIAKALSQITANTLVISIQDDILFPAEEQKELQRLITGAEYAEIASVYGHDGFLIETEALTRLSADFLNLKEPLLVDNRSDAEKRNALRKSA